MSRTLLILSLLGLTLSIAPGCAPRKRAPTVVPVPANGFVKHWGAALELKRDEPDRLFLRDTLVLLYTRDNRSYVFSAAGGELLTTSSVTSPDSELRAPALVGDKIVYPTVLTLEVYERRGRKVSSLPLERATRSGAAPSGNFIYIGIDYGNGGRLAKIDITKAFGRTVWELMTFGSVSATPAVYEETIYAASEDGRVYAVAANRDPIWPTDGNTFLTAGPIVADVKADDFGVYVASTDSKLYCLDRATGRIKWSYYGGTPLRTSPIITADRVYQFVPGRGIVAIDKIEGKMSREPLWTQRRARRFLSADDKYVYVLMSDNSIAALDKTNGQPQFSSKRKDFALSVENTRDSTIYVCTRKGEVLAIKPILKPGTVGEIVLSDTPIEQLAAR